MKLEIIASDPQYEHATVPEFIKALDFCFLWYRQRDADSALLKIVNPTQLLIVTCPEACPDMIQHFRKAGGKVLLYTSLYKVPILNQVPTGGAWRNWEGGSPSGESASLNPFWRAVAADDDKRFIMTDDSGAPMRPFDQASYMPGWHRCDQTSATYQERVVRGIEAVVADGRFDGVFIDNFTPREDNHGSDLDSPALYKLLSLVRDTGSRCSRSPFIICLNGMLSEAQEPQELADLAMLENSLYAWTQPQPRFSDAEYIERVRTALPTLQSRGGRLISLSYLGFSGEPIETQAEHCYDLCRQTGSIYADMFTLVDPAMASGFVKKNWKEHCLGDSDELALRKQALQNETEGNPAFASEFYQRTIKEQ